MEPLSEAALGVLRDKTIADYLREHCCGTTVFSKQDHGQKLLDHITQQFKLAGLPVPQTYMKSVDNLAIRVNKLMADKTGHFKKDVDANCELVRYVLALRGIDTYVRHGRNCRDEVHVRDGEVCTEGHCDVAQQLSEACMGPTHALCVAL